MIKTRNFTYKDNARDFVDGMVEALRTVGPPAEDAIWGIEIHQVKQQKTYGIGNVHVKWHEQYQVEWQTDD